MFVGRETRIERSIEVEVEGQKEIRWISKQSVTEVNYYILLNL